MIRVTENIHYTPKLSTTSVQILSRWTTVPKFKSHATHRYEWWVQTNVYLSHDRPRATRNFTRRITDLVVVLFLKRETLCRSHRNKMKSSFFTFVRLDKSISNKLYSFLLLLLFLLPDVFSLFQQDKTKTGKITKKKSRIATTLVILWSKSRTRARSRPSQWSWVHEILDFSDAALHRRLKRGTHWLFAA